MDHSYVSGQQQQPQSSGGPDASVTHDAMVQRATRSRHAQRAQSDDVRRNSVQASGGVAQGEGAVQEAAARGVAGAGGSLPHGDRIQASFGRHDVSGVRAHVGGQAADAADRIGADAYATGSDVAFGESPSLHLAAHEAAHTVQQRGGVQLAGGVGRAGDAHERNADDVADAVVAGRSAESLLDAYAGPTSGGVQRTPSVQRFESREHKHLGDEGARTEDGQARTVELAPGYSVTFGDLTAMSGDFFGDVAEIRTLANHNGTGPGTREEVEYVRVVQVHGDSARESSFSQAARDAVMARYYRLAGNNADHFTRPDGHSGRTAVNNQGSYAGNHTSAIREAARAAAAGETIDRALLYEGFASHFLTDGYASGHVRTERTNIKQHWDARVPMFWHNFKLFIAERMAYYINEHTGVGTIMTVNFFWNKVRTAIDEAGLPELTFGDLVGGALHDVDNHEGVVTQHGTLVGDGQLRDGAGAAVTGSDGSRRPEATQTEDLAIEAVRISLAEVDRAFQLGATASPEGVERTVRPGPRYAAEALWPQAAPEAQQTTPSPPWEVDTVEALLGDAGIQHALMILGAEKADLIANAVTFEDETGVSAAVQRRALITQVADPLRSRPVETLRTIIDYTPSTAGGLDGNDDFNAREYIVAARDAGALGTLTNTQRERLVRHLVDGVCSDDDEDAIVELLDEASTSDLVSVVRSLGGGSAAEGVDYLDSGVDGAQWRQLERILRQSSTLAPHL